MNNNYKKIFWFTLGMIGFCLIVMVPTSFATHIDEQKVFNVQAFLKKETVTQWIVGITWNAEPFGSIQNCDFISVCKIYDRNGTLQATVQGGGGVSSPAIWNSNNYCKGDWSGIQFTGSKTFTKNANYYYVEIYIFAYYWDGITQLDWLGDTAVFYFPRTDNSCPLQAGDPVNLSNGNQSHRQTDLSLDTPAGKLTFEHAYNAALGNTSDDYNVGPLGRGWTFNNNYSLSLSGVAPSRTAIFQKEDGKIIQFQETSGIFRQTTPGERFKLTDNGSGAFTVLKDDGSKIHFVNTIDDNAGYLRTDWIEDVKGRRLTFTYASHQYALNVWTELPTQICDQWGNGFGFTHEYVPNAYCDHYTGRIESVYNLKTPTEKVTFAYTQPTTETYTGMHNLATATYPDNSVIHYYYDDANNPNSLTRAVDEKGDTRYYTYDQYNRANGQHKEGNVNQLTMNYDWRQQGDGTWTVTATDSLSRNRVYTLSDSGNERTINVAGPTCGGGCGSTKKYKYDKTNGNLLETEDGNGIKNQYTNYDAWGNAAILTEAVGTAEQRVTTSSHHASLNVLLSTTFPSVLGAGNKETIYDYDDDGNGTPNENPTPFLHRLIEKGYTRDVSGAIVLREQITTYAYNSAGQIASINGPRTDVTDVTAYTYYPDNSGQGNNRAMLYQVTNPESQTTTYGDYDAYGRVGSITDPKGLITQYAYGFKGRVTTITLVAAGPTGEDLITNNFYEANGTLDYVRLPEGGVIDYGYDAADRLISIIRRIGPNASSTAIDSIMHTYDTEGNKTAETLHEGETTGPTKKSTTFAYDDYNRLWKLIHASSTYQEYGYDAAENRTSVINEKTKETTSIFDALNRLKTLTQPVSIVTGYSYDPQDNLTQVTDANGKVTTYEYDDFARVLKVNSPDAGIVEYRYDDAGNLIKKIDALGIITNYTYDTLNRMLTLDLPGTSQDIAYSYDTGTNGIGRLTNITDPSGTIAFQYDKQGNLTQEQKTMDSHVFITQYQYDKNGNLEKITYPNGREVTYTLNQTNRITKIDSVMGGNSKTLSQTIAYYPFGPMQTYQLGNGINTTLPRDLDYQLTDLQAGSIINRHYEYDRNGNVQSISNLSTPTLTPEQKTYFYQNNNNQLTQAINENNTTYGYNSAGNLITEQKSGVTRTFTYNDHHRLITVTENSTTLGEYTYDALGRRTKKVAGETTTLYIYDQNGLLISEYDGSGNWQKDYLYLNEQPLTMIVAGTPENVYYYHNDHLGTPQIMMDNTGAVVWSAQYEPFGETTIAPSSATTNNLRFPGQYFDAESGLCCNWHRDYKQELGRYIESDPIGLEGGTNLYNYCFSNPIIWFDQYGLWLENVHSGVGNPNYGTYAWARQAGFTEYQATLIARGNQGTDAGFGSWMPFLGLQQRHFNQLVPTQRPYTDSRFYWAFKELQRAIDYLEKDNCEAAYGHLGKGLHSIQDFYAHYDWETGLSGMKRHPDWYDDWNDPRNNFARQQTESMTNSYLGLFQSLTEEGCATRSKCLH